MIIKSLELMDFRNYEALNIQFGSGINILYGDNAQGKTNILEAIFLSATTKSHRGTKDKDIIRFGAEEGHIRLHLLNSENVESRIDIHIRKSKTKGIAIDGVKLKKATELLGKLNVVLFSPEDLDIIKGGPGERRRFTDMELCQLDDFYIYNLNNYNKIVNQRNNLLKDLYFNPSLKETIGIWDSQLVSYGSKVIERRQSFVDQLNDVIGPVHEKLSGGRESLRIIYDPNVSIENFEKELSASTDKDIKSKMTNVGPHRDDFIFMIGDLDVRRFGSQGQQRTAALSLKLAEIDIVKKLANDTPVLLLDDVLSELDTGRQNFLLDSIGDVQTIVTCTGLEEFVNGRLKIDKVFEISNGTLVDSK
ncbi:MAG: DNA replication/repair protein RecF [Lachnospiraceae bacterium]|nr:DNA replication/repair protein RecF [Lachnospiraceae bacterium]